ncbi:MAG: sugar-binding protein [Candidatus Brocadiia bacterium]
MERSDLPLTALVLLACGVAGAAVSPPDIEALWHKLPPPRLALAPTATPPAIDGEIGEEEWRDASQVTDFVGIDHAKWKGTGGFDHVDAQSWVFVTYDASYLYVAFRSVEPETETLKVKPREDPHDGDLWWDDCVELFLAPPDLEGHVHLIVNSQGAVYDARNPPGVRRGKGWDLAGLQVAARVAPGAWTVELALPFAGLGTEAPKPGEVWGANFARERYAAAYKAVVEQSTWSGLTGGFERPEMFGQICFAGVRQAIRLPRPFLGLNILNAPLGGSKPGSVKLEVQVAGSEGTTVVGSASGNLPPGGLVDGNVAAKITTEGTQLLALLVRDAESGDVLSCTRVPFHVPRVLTASDRVTERLTKLEEKAEEGSAFARSIGRQAAELEAVAAEAKALLAGLERRAADEAERKAWRALHDRVAKVEAATTFVVWTCSPYIATGPSSMPPALGAPPKLVVQAAQNEVEHVVVNVTNLSDEPMEFQLDGRLPGQAGRPRSGLDTTVQKLARHHPRLLGKKPKDLPEKEDGLAMPLIELGELATFFVQPLSTRQVWVTVHTGEMEPGTRTHRLRLVPLSRPLPALAVPVELTVWPVRIATEAPIGVFCFDYAGDFQWLRCYKVNIWFRGSFPHRLEVDAEGNITTYKSDIDRVKQRLEQGAEKFLFSYGYTGAFIDWAKKRQIPYMSDRWKALFKKVLARMVVEWREAGLDYGDFALQTIDEAHGHQVEQVVETTPLIREVDPRVRTAMTIMTGLEDLKRMAPHVDVWVNRNGAMWGEAQWDFFHAEQAKGKPIWSWNMPCTPKSRPLTDFRTYGWRAMKFDFDAIGFFLYFGLVYDPMRQGGGFATRHWEAWRDGVEDYQLLHALEQAIAEARKRGVDARKLAPAHTVLEEAVDEVITEKFFPPNTQETDERIRVARARVAREIARVRAMR